MQILKQEGVKCVCRYKELFRVDDLFKFLDRLIELQKISGRYGVVIDSVILEIEKVLDVDKGEWHSAN